MWVKSGFEPDAFWHQSPLTFQIIMRGVRERREAEIEASIAASHNTASMTAATQSKRGLRPLDFYLKRLRRRNPDVQTPAQMLANMSLIAARVNRKFKKDS